MPKDSFASALDALPEKKSVQTETKQIETKKETPVLEIKTEEKKEVLSNIEDKNKIENQEGKTKQSDQPQFTDESFYKYATEMAGRDIKSKEDFFVDREVEKIVDREVPLEYLTEFGKGYEQYFKEKGRSPQDYLNLNRDLDALSQEQVVRETLATSNPSLDQTELNYLYNRKYGIDKEEMTESEVMDRQISFKSDYDKGKRSMESEKEKYLIPKENSIASIEAKNQEQINAQAEGTRLWQETVGQTSSTFKQIDIDLGEDFKFSHSVDSVESGIVKDITMDNTMQKWQAQYANDQGALDTSKIQQDLYILRNLPKILSEVAEQATAKALEGKIKEAKNPDFMGGKKVIPKQILTKKAEQGLDLMKAKYRIK